MQHLGYASYFCRVCEKDTVHKLVEAQAEDAKFILKLCVKCQERKEYEKALQEVA